MKKIITLLLYLTFICKVYGSNSCDPSEVYKYKEIECCLSSALSEIKCRKLIDELPFQFLTSVQQLVTDITENSFQSGKTPNCFWSALAFSFPELLEKPRTWYEYEIADFLTFPLNSHICKSSFSVISQLT